MISTFKLTLISLLVLAGNFGMAQKEKVVKSKVKEVTVFLSGAQVTRDASIALGAGNTEIIFRGLENNINPKSIQVSAPPEILINKVVKEVNYLENVEMGKEVKAIRDSIRILDDLLRLEKNKRVTLEKERDMILQNQKLGGSESGLSVEELEKAANFYRKRMANIFDLLYKSDRRKEKNIAAKTRLNNQLSQMNFQENVPSQDIRVTVSSSAARTVKMALNFMVQDAGWSPTYDLRAKNTSSPIQLDYRANVWQGSGQDWKNVMLTLSTGNPRVGGTQPVLGPWSLYLYDPVVYTQSRGRTLSTKDAKRAPSPSYEKSAEEVSDDYAFGEANTLANFTQVEQGATTVEFKISVKQDVPANRKPQQVAIARHEINTGYEHFAVPKLDKDAFLLARLSGWEEYDLLPGKANVFFEGTYVSEIMLNPGVTLDTLDISLGRDKKVVIKRDQLKDFTKTQSIGANVKKTFAFEISVRNTKNEAISIRIEDQIPLSQNDDITIKLIEVTGGGKLEEKTGKINWNLDLKPAETKTFRLVYEVKHPKKKVVRGL